MNNQTSSKLGQIILKINPKFCPVGLCFRGHSLYLFFLPTSQATLLPKIIFQGEHRNVCIFPMRSMKEGLSSEGPSKGCLSSLDGFKKHSNLRDVFTRKILPQAYWQCSLSDPRRHRYCRRGFNSVLGTFSLFALIPQRHVQFFWPIFCSVAAEQFLPSQNTGPWCCPACIAGDWFPHWGVSRRCLISLLFSFFPIAFLMVAQAGFFIYQCPSKLGQY